MHQVSVCEQNFAAKFKFCPGKVAKNNRFGEVSPSEIQQLFNNAIPEATKKATKFGINIFNIGMKV